MNNLQRGHIYFLVMRDPRNAEHDFGLVKVGITEGDVLQRAAALQTGNPYDLLCFDSFETPWPREVEHFMHRTHAKEMLKAEWLRWSRDDLPNLVDEAKKEARRIEDRKSKEQAYTALASNGQVRRATPHEFDLHREARKLLKDLVPAKLGLKTAENRIHEATGATLGIPGIVRVKYIPAASRFDEGLAESKFPLLASQCRVEQIHGGFRWRGVPKESDFADKYQEARSAEELAEASSRNVLQNSVGLQGWTDRTPELERWHDDFLQALPKVHRLNRDLADLRTELILGIGDCDALDPVCSFIRRSVPKIDRSAFQGSFPEESKQCEVPVAPRLRKHVYPARAYL
ncbi:MAG: GIY-YIG nuclease family protein [Bryobacteraceae bacterium]|jgi:hypothetical protein